jgi:hypothetical protein
MLIFVQVQSPAPIKSYAKSKSLVNKLFFFIIEIIRIDRLCGLVVRVSGYTSKGPGFDSQSYQIFWEVWNGVHSASWGQLRSYLNEKVAAPVQKTEINGRGNSLRWPRNTLYLQKLALTSPTSGGRLFNIVRLRTKATEFSFISVEIIQILK